MQSNREERDIQQALGSIPKVNNQRAFSCTVTVAGTGIGDITVQDVFGAAKTQHEVIRDASDGVVDQMYVHKIRAYGTAGGYLSMAPYPHRQYCNIVTLNGGGGDFGAWINSYDTPIGGITGDYRAGTLTQMYEFGINGATRPELVWDYPKTEVLNNPFTLSGVSVFGDPDPIGSSSQCKLCTLQSTNTGGSALYIVQFEITLRCSNFIEIAPALGAAAFGEKNVITDNYKAPNDFKKRVEEAQKAQEMANKKRKVQSVKDLTLPALDSA